jgi:hypothetical protein
MRQQFAPRQVSSASLRSPRRAVTEHAVETVGDD